MPQTTIYHSSSRGPMLIADMSYQPAKNAVEALRRRDPSRTDEIEALDAHLADLSVKYEAALREEYPGATPERQVEIATELARLEAARA